MNERILNLLSLCMQAKEKGIDVFFYYSPHVECISVTVYKNGWKEAVFENGEFVKSFEDANLNAHIKANDAWTLEEVEAEISSIEAYLKGLIS